ncbi:MAG: hypothetical protein HYV77_03035 [Candidatus Wildermuthbacteria bacterium]|nr:hypothetical protein [Candidatus Wildermuthbacteria bacterium]
MRRSSIAAIIISIVFLFPIFANALETNLPDAPKNLEESKSFASGILKKLPEGVKNVWEKTAVPVWKTLCSWASKVWETIKDFISRLFLGKKADFEREINQEKQELEQELKKESSKSLKGLWNRLISLIGLGNEEETTQNPSSQ